MKFKKDQQVVWGKLRGRIESGPWLSGNAGSVYREQRYLVELLTGDSAGRYRFYSEDDLCPMAPQKGDRGYAAVGDEVYTIHYIDDDIALLKQPSPDWQDGRRWFHLRRYEFDLRWRPES